MNYIQTEIENKHKTLIDISKKHMDNVNDLKHNYTHVQDVIDYVIRLSDTLNFDTDVCLIATYWHDVGRSIKDEGHEKISADMLKKEMLKLKYPDDFIKSCYKAIEHHGWNMTPETTEGLVLKDADKLAWLGIRRWKSCLEGKEEMDSIVNLLPELRNKILYYDESRVIYDEIIVDIFNLLYNKIYRS